MTAERPLGLLASIAGQPVGWCACGPRSRYAAAEGDASRLLLRLDRNEDDAVWLLPCLFVGAGFRGQGVTQALMRSAVDLARREGAKAIEGWPTTESGPKSADAFLGRERAFAALGFRRVAWPSRDRVIMRLELGKPSPPS